MDTCHGTIDNGNIQVEHIEKLELTEEEEVMQEKVCHMWADILKLSTIEDHTDFFKSGAGSMDVTRCHLQHNTLSFSCTSFLHPSRIPNESHLPLSPLHTYMYTAPPSVHIHVHVPYYPE